MAIVFLHAHPDDEAIFTGGTMRLLADAGAEVVLVVATRGERGLEHGSDGPLGDHRTAETLASADALGIARVWFLGYDDSGLVADPDHAEAFAHAPVDEAVERLAEVLHDTQVDALVAYDEAGIYGHPDHVAVHRVARRAAVRLGIPTVYEATVDREYLHFVETHLVEEAGQALNLPVGPLDDADAPYEPHLAVGGTGTAPLGIAASGVGLPSVLIDCHVDVRPVIAAKRTAMGAHASQIPADSSAWRLPPPAFAEVYGFEWYTRTGPPTALDALAGPGGF